MSQANPTSLSEPAVAELAVKFAVTANQQKELAEGQCLVGLAIVNRMSNGELFVSFDTLRSVPPLVVPQLRDSIIAAVNKADDDGAG